MTEMPCIYKGVNYPNVNHTFQNVQFQTVFYNPSKDFFGRVFCDFMKILNTTVKQKFIIKLHF